MYSFLTRLSELIGLIVYSFRLSVLLPAIAFVFAHAIVIFPLLRYKLIGQFYYIQDQTVQTLLLALLTVFVAYFLSVFNFSIIRLFEGYSILALPLLSKLGEGAQNAHRQYYLDLKSQYKNKSEELDKLQRKVEEIQMDSEVDPDIQTRLEEAEKAYQTTAMQHVIIMTRLMQLYPSDTGKIAPTRLGNAIASAEEHPSKLYGMDAVVLWRLLLPILTDKGYTKYIEHKKTNLDFLLNSLILSVLLGFEVFVISWRVHNASANVLIFQLTATIIAALVLYQLSIDGAIRWGITIRTSFDLYRDDLRQALRIKHPNNFYEERKYWEKISKFYREQLEKQEYDHIGECIFDFNDIDSPQKTEALTPENATNRTNHAA